MLSQQLQRGLSSLIVSRRNLQWGTVCDKSDGAALLFVSRARRES
jgi:methionyl-tRNA synthetase